MLRAALESEVDAFLEEHAVLLDECDRRRVVRNGYLPTREIATARRRSSRRSLSTS